MTRLLAPLYNKLFLMLGRAVLKAVNNSDLTQKVQVVALKDETLTDVEHFQNYGFEHFPEAGAEVYLCFLNGNRDQGQALLVHDRRYRPSDLSEGDVCVYSKTDATTGHRIHLKASTAAIESKAAKYKFENQAGTIELIDLIDQLLTLLQGNVDLVGIASTGTLSLILAQLATLQAQLQSIKG